MSLSLAFPWLLVLLPLPLLMRYLLPPHAERRAAVRAPFFAELVQATGERPAAGAVVARSSWVQRFVLVPLCWVLLVVGLARPQLIEEPITKTTAVRDLMLAVDLSGSMETRDFVTPSGERIDRLTAVKGVVDEFIARREGDRLGLILFGTAPFVQVPFTEDREICRLLLAEAGVGMAGPQTMLGDAIGLAIKVFEQSESPQKVLILLTDGNDTRSRVPPAKAAEIAAERGVTIHTIGVGDPAAAGELVLDGETLEQIATTTGGRYFRAMDRDELDSVYRTLDELEPYVAETLSYRPRRELAWVALLAVVSLVLVYHAVVASYVMLRPGEA